MLPLCVGIILQVHDFLKKQPNIWATTGTTVCFIWEIKMKDFVFDGLILKTGPSHFYTRCVQTAVNGCGNMLEYEGKLQPLHRNMTIKHRHSVLIYDNLSVVKTHDTSTNSYSGRRFTVTPTRWSISHWDTCNTAHSADWRGALKQSQDQM